MWERMRVTFCSTSLDFASFMAHLDYFDRSAAPASPPTPSPMRPHDNEPFRAAPP